MANSAAWGICGAASSGAADSSALEGCSKAIPTRQEPQEQPQGTGGQGGRSEWCWQEGAVQPREGQTGGGSRTGIYVCGTRSGSTSLAERFFRRFYTTSITSVLHMPDEPTTPPHSARAQQDPRHRPAPRPAWAAATVPAPRATAASARAPRARRPRAPRRRAARSACVAPRPRSPG